MADLSIMRPVERLGGMFLPFGILAVVAMMVLPLPVFLLDMFFVFNILLSLLILMVAMHTYRPLDFSSFPSLLLIATVLRLALNVASTRIVLSEGHTGSGAAGRVIEAFGEFVIAGNFAVGIFVFAILVIINLVVITKGAGRVSEVSARFTLDAMPGKQMAIDADLNAGILSQDEAKARRADVAEEADFYGAMDGASKFVKGDAVAGILILVINIVGGIIIGASQHGMALIDASQAYVLLSVGDGLVAQIPSLLLSIATAIIVTRVSSTNDMATHIGKQVNLSRAWVPVAAVMMILGLVPGMPNMLFIVAALAAGGAAFLAHRADGANAEEDDATVEMGEVPATNAPGTITADEVTDYSPISIQIGYGLISMIEDGNGGPLVSRITSIRREVSQAMGFVVPGVRIRDDLTMGSNQYRIRIGQTIVAEDTCYPDRKLALPGGLSKMKLKGVDVKDPSFGIDAVWIQPHQQSEAEADDHVVVEPESVIATHLSQMLYKHASQLLGPDDVQVLLSRLEKVSPTLVDAVVPKLVPLHSLTAVLRHLLADRIPIGDMRRILEGLSELAGRNMAPAEMAESLRPQLAALLIQQLVPLNQPLPLVTLEPELEQLLLRSRQQQGPDAPLMLENGLAETMLTALARVSEDMAAQGRQPFVIVSPLLRRAFSRFVSGRGSDAIVLAVNELPDNRRIEVVATLGGGQPAAPMGSSEPVRSE
ncbi:flagellar biosynthesis protein FlhA [Rhodovulum sp. FJ3]|uniref:flagellar biosynthesis protein FlhA n=1 Tax=Rhodovulum sp. FJ3 TaxID=3079053 RepID=UPI00293DF117|nr:flagellar biosynthesis protein FlhA [Rhodovulum sp. FJ3]MDV4167559.1 flagellar biosynthesis protein FlhA [Rhodovulum sp. FJ3]